MKTSNKILLGIFLTFILLSTTVNLIVLAKYKRGEYSAFRRDEYNIMTSYAVPATKFVSLTAVGNCILQVSDKPRYEVRADKVNLVSYRVVNDTLIINGDSTLTRQELDRGISNNRELKLYLPAGVHIHMANSGLAVNGGIDSAHAPSYSIDLTKKSYFYIRERKKEPEFFNQLLLTGDESNIALEDHVVVNELNLKVIECNIDSKKATIKNMTLDMDKKSTITFSGNSINALK